MTSKSDGGLEGKVALVTGGSTGIGAATVERLARDGASVLATARDAERGQKLETNLRAAGLEVRFEAGDVAQRADCERMVASVVERFGRLDIVVNNAAALQVTSVEDTEDDDWGAGHRDQPDQRLPRVQGGHPAPARGRWRGHRQHRLGPCACHDVGPRGLRCGQGRRRRALAPDGPRPGPRQDPGQLRRRRRHRHGDEPQARAGDGHRGHRRDRGLRRPGPRPDRPPVGDRLAIRFLLGPDASFVNGSAFVVDGGLLAKLAI